MPIRTRRFSISRHVNYQYGAKLGQGSFGEVWEVFTPSAAPYSREEHPVAAMKIIRSPHDDSWNEVELLKKIEHPHIAKYLTSFQNTEGSLCIIMEYCDGGPFTKMIGEAGFNMEEFAIWRTISHIASALDYLHKRHIMHRDLKPDNILAKFDGYDPDEDGNMYDLKICDFGVAKLLNRHAQDLYYTRTSVGTSTYMAPEVLQGGGVRYTTSADIWALGAFISFYGNKGRHLFPNEFSVGRFHPQRDYTLNPSKYSQDLIGLVEDMLDLNPRGRPTAAQLVSETRKGRRQDKY